jgi:hypothetical protein
MPKRELDGDRRRVDLGDAAVGGGRGYVGEDEDGGVDEDLGAELPPCQAGTEGGGKADDCGAGHAEEDDDHDGDDEADGDVAVTVDADRHEACGDVEDDQRGEGEQVAFDLGHLPGEDNSRGRDEDDGVDGRRRKAAPDVGCGRASRVLRCGCLSRVRQCGLPK